MEEANSFSLIRSLSFAVLLCYHENMKKAWIIYMIVMPILVVLGLRFYVSLHSRDIDPIDDTDLVLVRPVISAENNAYPVCRKNVICWLIYANRRQVQKSLKKK
jgi:hypothetical protein